MQQGTSVTAACVGPAATPPMPWNQLVSRRSPGPLLWGSICRPQTGHALRASMYLLPKTVICCVAGLQRNHDLCHPCRHATNAFWGSPLWASACSSSTSLCAACLPAAGRHPTILDCKRVSTTLKGLPLSQSLSSVLQGGSATLTCAPPAATQQTPLRPSVRAPWTA